MAVLETLDTCESRFAFSQCNFNWHHSNTSFLTGYTVMTFTVNDNELHAIQTYLGASFSMQLGFDSVGMYLAALPIQINPCVSRSKTFCSKHVTCALKAANIEAVQGVNENIVTPSRLFRYDVFAIARFFTP